MRQTWSLTFCSSKSWPVLLVPTCGLVATRAATAVATVAASLARCATVPEGLSLCVAASKGSSVGSTRGEACCQTRQSLSDANERTGVRNRQGWDRRDASEFQSVSFPLQPDAHPLSAGCKALPLNNTTPAEVCPSLVKIDQSKFKTPTKKLLVKGDCRSSKQFL